MCVLEGWENSLSFIFGHYSKSYARQFVIEGEREEEHSPRRAAFTVFSYTTYQGLIMILLTWCYHCSELTWGHAIGAMVGKLDLNQFCFPQPLTSHVDHGWAGPELALVGQLQLLLGSQQCLWQTTCVHKRESMIAGEPCLQNMFKSTSPQWQPQALSLSVSPPWFRSPGSCFVHSYRTAPEMWRILLVLVFTTCSKRTWTHNILNCIPIQPKHKH